jgi:hypothetical protein
VARLGWRLADVRRLHTGQAREAVGGAAGRQALVAKRWSPSGWSPSGWSPSGWSPSGWWRSGWWPSGEAARAEVFVDDRGSLGA